MIAHGWEGKKVLVPDLPSALLVSPIDERLAGVVKYRGKSQLHKEKLDSDAASSG